ncbi:MAG TPA: ABC transporter permease subunit [Jatrophihabitans sp.]|nr:ABC transporter permease subunit [Jatrophihabitans sp.]
MTAELTTDPVGGDRAGAAPTFGRLLTVELRRLAYRRFARVLALLAVLGLAAAVFAIYARHQQTSPTDLAAASRARDAQIAEIQQSIDECTKSLPAGADPQQQCGFAPTADDIPLNAFLHRRPLEPAKISDYALAIGVAVAMLGFAIGASFIGAEWSSKNLICWLYWEPRRLRLLAAKLLALLSVMLAVACLAQLAWFGIAHLLLHYRGLPVSSLGPKARNFWRHILDGQLRAILLVVPTTVLGFAIANLIRHTAAAFGVGFVYFAVVESLIRAFDRDWQPYLLTTNIGAWISNGGLTVYGRQTFDRRVNAFTPRPIHLSNAHGATVLAVYSVLILLVSLAVFRRRDVS